MPKLLQCHRQPRAPRKRSVPSVNDHPAIFDIFQKLYENGPCIQTISFRVTMLSPLSLSLSEVLASNSFHLLPVKQSSSDSIPSCNIYFAISAENHCGCDACAGGGGGGGGVSSLPTGFCVIGAFRFACFISSSGNCCSLNHKGTSSSSIFLVHTEV